MAINCSSELVEALNKPRRFQHKHIGEILLQTGIITNKQLQQAITEKASKYKTERLGKVISKLGFATEHQIINALACCLEIPFIQLSSFEITHDIVDQVPAEFARAHGLIPLIIHKERLVIALEDPTDTDTLNMLHFITGHIIEPVISSPEEIEYAISQHYGQSDDEEVLKELPTDTKLSQWEEQQARKQAKDKPTVKLIHNLIIDAINRRASDIHIRPKEHEVDILFRVDGSLMKIRSFDRSLLSASVARIKIIGGMNIAEHRVPQDGRTKVKTKDKVIDLRISIIPTIHGESVVLRILDTTASLKSIKDIGFTEQDSELFTQLVNKSSGLVLVTGPTGSGKSTTLYAALQEIKEREINIITVEDPVEYHVDDILQIQVHSSIGYTFAKALRHILRHDPDAIMIGEIRDEETAKIAVESSLTGHLVLSTLHTNSAAATITRLLEIGIQPYLLNSTLLAVLAQRLVKRNCPHCLEEENVSEAIRKQLNLNQSDIFYKGKGCDQCHNIGYSGRLAVYELLTTSTDVRKLIQPKVNAADIEEAAIAGGMVPLTQRAIELAKQKSTSIEEVYRVRLS